MATRNFLCWGYHAVRATLASDPNQVLEIWFREDASSDNLLALKAQAEAAGLLIQRVPHKTLDKLSEQALHQGVVVRRRPPPSLNLEAYIAQFETAQKPPLLLVLDQVQDPQNFGACLRVADGAGADAVLVPQDNSAPLSGVVAKAASGALDSTPLIVVPNLARALDSLKQAGMWFIGTLMDAESSIYDCDLDVPCGLILGSEGSGLRRLTRDKCDILAHIPMSGELASLNVATATAIVLFEARRQRR